MITDVDLSLLSQDVCTSSSDAVLVAVGALHGFIRAHIATPKNQSDPFHMLAVRRQWVDTYTASMSGPCITAFGKISDGLRIRTTAPDGLKERRRVGVVIAAAAGWPEGSSVNKGGTGTCVMRTHRCFNYLHYTNKKPGDG